MINVPLPLRSDQLLYLDTWMDRVSRSFAVVVLFLEGPLKHYLSTAYLLCRVVDNIEDTTQAYHWKSDRFNEVALLLERPFLAADILATWEEEPWPGLTQDQQLIMALENGLPLWDIFARIPEKPQGILRKWILEMVIGMRDLELPDRPPQLREINGIKVLSTHQDYEDYCYIVAGTVGHLATELVINQYHILQSEAAGLLAGAESCGRSLQKTNILKDFSEDLSRGMSYLPEAWLRECGYSPLDLQGAPDAWKFHVMEDVLEDLFKATRYVLAIPKSATGYRQASLMCLFPAYQTLSLAADRHQQLFTPRHQFKISRQTLTRCLEDATSLASDDAGILRYSDDMQSSIRQAMALPSWSSRS